MHEMSIAQSMLAIVLEEAGTHGLKSLSRIHIKVGELTAVVPEALEFCFGVIAEGTPAEGAFLEIELVPAQARCNACARGFRFQGPLPTCPNCGGPGVITGGEELLVEFIEGEEE